MIKFIKYTVLVLVIHTTFTISVLAQTALWQGKGRIAISSDGNEHDDDDWAATPVSLAIIAAKGLQDKLALYTYSDHIWGSNQNFPSKNGMSAYEHMRESALNGAYYFGFDKNRFICAVDNAEVAYRAMCNEINKSSEDNPLIIVAAGPMQVVGEAINRAELAKRQYVTVVSHSKWNNEHSDKPHKQFWDNHFGWTFDKMCEDFGTPEGGNVKFVKILDQNGGDDYIGLNAKAEMFDWIKSSSAKEYDAYKKGSWDWLYSRISICRKANNMNFDMSDAGMVAFIFTGIEKTSPNLIREILENPN